jgi:uncharacterized protein YebE (UPF0316 family)
MDWNVLLTAGGIFLLRVVGNMSTTVRLVMIVRGQKVISAFLAVFESLIFALTLGSVVTDLDNVWNLMAYSVGFAVGGTLGLMLEQRLIQRYVSLQVVSAEEAHPIAEAIRAAGYGATEGWGQGADGQRGTVTAVIGHHQVKQVMSIVEEIDPGAFVMVNELRAIAHGHFRRLLRHEQ